MQNNYADLLIFKMEPGSWTFSRRRLQTNKEQRADLHPSAYSRKLEIPRRSAAIGTRYLFIVRFLLYLSPSGTINVEINETINDNI